MTFEVTFLPEGMRIQVPKGTTILHAALKAGVDLSSICNGRGSCGKCLIEVLEGNLSPLSDAELEYIPKEKLSKNFRLACQASIKSSVKVRIPQQSRIGKQRLVIMGREPAVKIDSNVTKLYVELPPPTIENPKGDDANLLEALLKKGQSDMRIDYTVSRSLSDILRKANWKVTVTILNNTEIINIQPGDTSDTKYGMAVDIGTTKLAVFIVDLTDGTTIFADGIINPQIRFGEDVISRITYASQGKKNLDNIQKTVTDGINELIQVGISKTGIRINDLSELVAVGNTAMHHLFLGLSVRNLAKAPYPAGMMKPFETKARNLGISMNPAGSVHTLPNIAGFVGADAISNILACRLHEKEGTTMLMDVGTNTEVMIGNKDAIWSCSTASGPAFEGAHIKHGMRAASGAIEEVNIHDDFSVEYNTIDDESPRGICGSGIIDTIAEMLKVGAMDTSGRISETCNRVREGPSEREFVLVDKEDTDTGKDDIVITQKDVREIQKAKAAMYGGYCTILNESNLKRSDIKEIIIAGAFGSYIKPTSARTIGMIPEMPLDIISFSGNTAGSGARMYLKSLGSRMEVKSIVKKVKYVELAAKEIFMEEYVNAMYLPHSRLEEFPETSKSIKAPKIVRRYSKRKK